MDIQVINEKENPLLKRREILASIDYHGGSTPSKADLQKNLADHFKVNMDNVEISKIISEVGMSKGKIWIKIWQEKKVPIYAEIKKEKKKKEKPKEEKKPEVPESEVEPKAELKLKKPAVEKKEVKEEAKVEEKTETPKEQPKEEKKE
ncbi:MAG: hypothetical protein GTN40_04365 [Candidatus Aenigmarchaeota archaeon]|nr:hypothetical protein [Candidatus Aenigmarchaeota archaeon]